MAKTQIQILELWNNAKKGVGDVDRLYDEAEKLYNAEDDEREKQFAGQVLRRFRRWMLTAPKAAK